MSITIKEFGTTKDNTKVFIYTISNSNGMTASFTNYGARWISCNIPTDNGLTDVILGYDTFSEYENDTYHFGSVIGRNANRISNGCFTLNNTTYNIPINEELTNSNVHSGPDYYGSRIWNAQVLYTANAVAFELISPDKDQGFPGNMALKVTYKLTEDNIVKLIYDGICESYSIFNPTNHVYFNLNGADSPSITNHVLWIDSNKITENENLLPNGNFADVQNTKYDFRTPAVLSEAFDDNWCIEKPYSLDKTCLTCTSPESGITLNMHTDLPGLQVYTGNFLCGVKGKNGTIYNPQSGVCLESQYFVNAINVDNADFVKPVIKPYEPVHSETWYRFTYAGDKQI